jgi:hypothetical protein
MNRSLSARLAKLEAARLVEPIILHFDDGKTRMPMIIQGTVKNFFRIVDAIPAYNNASPRFMRGVFLALYLLCRAARIEGRSAQLFSLDLPPWSIRLQPTFILGRIPSVSTICGNRFSAVETRLIPWSVL